MAGLMQQERIILMHEWFPWYPADYRADTYHISLAEDGAYRRLIDEYMITRRPLPDNESALARIAGVGGDEWASISSTVRAFFTPADGVLRHKRCDTELDAQDALFKVRSRAGRANVAKRHAKNNQQKQQVATNGKAVDYQNLLQDRTGQDKTKKVVEAAQAQPPPKKTPKRKTQLKEERLPAEWREYASANQPFMDADLEFENFRGYYLSHGKPMANWLMCWQRWVRNYGKFGQAAGVGGGNGVSEKTQRAREATVRGLVEPDPFATP